MNKYQNSGNRLNLSGKLLIELVNSLEPLDDERRPELVNLNHITLVNTAINLADLLLKTLAESSQNYQFLIDRPKYKKKEKVVLTCSNQQSVQTIKEVYFDHSQDEWLYKFEPNSLAVHEFYSETFLSKILD